MTVPSGEFEHEGIEQHFGLAPTILSVIGFSLIGMGIESVSHAGEYFYAGLHFLLVAGGIELVDRVSLPPEGSE